MQLEAIGCVCGRCLNRVVASVTALAAVGEGSYIDTASLTGLLRYGGVRRGHGYCRRRGG